MSNDQLDRLRELEALDADGAPLTEADYAELRDLMQMENDRFIRHG